MYVMIFNRYFLICLWLTLLLFTTASSAFSLDVYLKEYTEYSKDVLYLGDIISVKNADQAAKAALLPLPLQLTSFRIHILSAYSVRKIIEKHYSGPLIIIGKSAICVPVNAIPEYSTWFIKDLLSFFIKHDYNSQGRLEIEILKMPLLDFQTQVSEVQFSIKPYHTSNGYLVGKVDIHASSSHEMNNFSDVISLYVHRFLHAAVPVRPLKQGERLLKSYLLFIEKDIAHIEENILLEGMACDHYITRVYLNASDTIPLAKLKTDFLVKTGDHINIIFISGGIQVLTKGRAIQSGYLGTEVLVQPFNLTKKFMGTILNGKEVLVDLK